jgi:hypothetical protein
VLIGIERIDYISFIAIGKLPTLPYMGASAMDFEENQINRQ